jgi:hypothetical protein
LNSVMMRRIHSLIRRPLALIVLLIVALPAIAHAQAGGDVAVVVHTDVAVESLTLAELRRITLGDREFWPGNTRLTLLIRAPIAHERDVVLRSICQMSEAQFRQHWIAKVFRADTAVAPKIVYSTEMAIDLVNRMPGAITFINAAEVPGRLKVLRIDGRMPGEKGYPLR